MTRAGLFAIVMSCRSDAHGAEVPAEDLRAAVLLLAQRLDDLGVGILPPDDLTRDRDEVA